MSTPHLSCSEPIDRPDARQLAPHTECAGYFGPAQPALAAHVPSPKQQQFLNLDCLEAFYGGAAGGGKSEALLMAALQYVHVPGYAALILRKDTPRLELAGGLIPRSLEWLSGKGPTWNASRRQWSFPTSGAPATLSFGYLAHPLDKYRYGSSEFQFIAFDELTEFTEEDYLFLFSRLRRIRSLEVPLRMRSASNPGGVGHLWVKQRFVSQGSEGSEISATVTPDSRPLTPVFIPARIRDNPGLDEEEYRRSLAHLPPLFRERLMNGDWSVQEEGMFRTDWLRYYVVAGKTAEQLEIRGPNGRPIVVVPTADCRRFCTIDPAGTSADKARESRGRPASYSVIQVWDQPRGEESKYLFLRHQWRGRVGFDGLVRVLKEIHRSWRPERLWIENENLGQATYDLLHRELPLETVATAGRDKATRAAPLVLKFERGEILLPLLNTTWRHDFEAELLAWTGRDDQPCDQIDAAAYAASVAETDSTAVLKIEPVTRH
jgi:phage terminase large subunit-like protein